MLNFFMFANQSLVFMHIESSDLPLSYFQVTAGREEMLRMCPILPMERERKSDSGGYLLPSTGIFYGSKYALGIFYRSKYPPLSICYHK